MRCILTAAATAAFLSLAPVTTWALPNAAADGLADEALGVFPEDAAVPVLNDALDSEDHEEQRHDAPAEDPVVRWLDSLSNLDIPDGAMLTSSMFRTLTVSSDMPSITPLARNSFLSSAPIFTTTLAVDDDASAPRPTPGIDASIQYQSPSQKSLGPLGHVWKSTKAKLKSISAFLCPDHDGGRFVVDVKNQHLLSTIQVHDELKGDAAGKAGLSSVVTDDQPSVSPSRPVPSNAIPTSIAVIPVATLPAAGATRLLATHLSNPTNTSDVQSQPTAIDHTNIKIMAAILSILATIVLSCIIFSIYIRRNPRRRAERLAKWEECMKIRAYRQAANRHRLRRWGQATFGRLWLFIGTGLTTTQIVGSDVEKDSHFESLLQDNRDTNAVVVDARVSQEIHSFRTAHNQIAALLRAEEGRGSRQKRHPADRNRRRTYMWLFGGRRNRVRSNSGSDSDAASVHSDSEKSALTGATPPPPYDDREKYEQVDDRFLIRIVTGTPDDSDRSSVSSLVPTSPKEGSMTLGSHDSYSEKGDS